MNRILEIPREKLTSEQKTVFDRLTEGRGRILGPYKIWIHSPTVASGMEHIRTFLNKRSSLSTREVEIVILLVAQHWNGEYVKQAHIRAGKAAGLSHETIDAILAGADPKLTDPHERRVHAFASALVGGSKVSDAEFAEVEAALGREGIAEGTRSARLLHVGGAGDEGARRSHSAANVTGGSEAKSQHGRFRPPPIRATLASDHAGGRSLMTTRRQFLNVAAAALAAPALPRLARAQSWPTRPIRAMIPFAPGSSLDIVGRLVLDPLASQLGQPIVVENRGGAGGSIGTAQVAKAEPDGYTLLIQASAHSAAPAAYPNISYDPARDFAAVIPFGTIPNVTVIAPEKGIKTLQDLVAKAKAGSISYASAGVGSATHWAAERLRVSAGFTGIHVPFRGGPEALTEVMTGRVDFTCMGMASALPLIRDGKLIALAVSTPKRSRALPDVPTTLEVGLCQF